MFENGDRVTNKLSGVKGSIIKVYKPTACEYQIMVKTDDGIQYHAPPVDWIRIKERGVK